MTSGITKSIKKLSQGVISTSSGDSVRTSRISVVDGTCCNMQDGISLFMVSGDALRDVHELLKDARSALIDLAAGDMPGELAVDVDKKLSEARFGGSKIFESGKPVSPKRFCQNTGKIVSDLISGGKVADVKAAGIDSASLGLTTACGDSVSTLSAVDSAIGMVASCRAVLEARISRMEDVTKKMAMTSANVVAAGSRITDVDNARAVMANTRMKILKKPFLSLAGQANQLHGNVTALMN